MGTCEIFLAQPILLYIHCHSRPCHTVSTPCSPLNGLERLHKVGVAAVSILVQQVLDAPQSVNHLYEAAANWALPVSADGIGKRGGRALLICKGG
jgi:hypothetical protein